MLDTFLCVLKSVRVFWERSMPTGKRWKVDKAMAENHQKSEMKTHINSSRV